MSTSMRKLAQKIDIRNAARHLWNMKAMQIRIRGPTGIPPQTEKVTCGRYKPAGFLNNKFLEK